jgi:hypothetical protein
MSTAKSDLRDFSVFQFSLGLGPDGRPRQQVTLRGSFVSVGDAFDSARRLAYEEADRLKAAESKAAEKPRLVDLIDTEWGYDIRSSWLVVTRFWVHDAAASCPIAVG